MASRGSTLSSPRRKPGPKIHRWNNNYCYPPKGGPKGLPMTAYGPLTNLPAELYPKSKAEIEGLVVQCEKILGYPVCNCLFNRFWPQYI